MSGLNWTALRMWDGSQRAAFEELCCQLAEAADKITERGATGVMAAVTHGVFAVVARERIDNSSIRSLLVADTVETQPEVLSAKVEVVPIRPPLRGSHPQAPEPPEHQRAFQ